MIVSRKASPIKAVQISENTTLKDLAAVTGGTDASVFQYDGKCALLIGGGVLESGDWLVRDNGSLEAYSDEEFRALYDTRP